MHRDKRHDVLETRRDGAGHHPGCKVVSEVALGKEGEAEAAFVGGAEQSNGVLVLRITPIGGQRSKRFRDGLRHLGRTDGRHGNGAIETELHRATLSDFSGSRWKPRQ